MISGCCSSRTARNAGDSTVLLRSFDPDTAADLPSSPTFRSGQRYRRAIEHVLLMQEQGALEATIEAIPDVAWIFDDNTHFHVLDPSNEPRVLIRDASIDTEKLTEIGSHVKQLLDVIGNAGDSTVLLRSYWRDDLVTDEDGGTLHGEQYNRVIQHLLLLEELGQFEATLVVVPNNRWPATDDDRYLALSPHTPVFAVAHRLPDQARIDLCVPTSDPDDPGVESAEDLTAVDTLHMPLPLPQDQISASGLWKQSAYKPILLGQGFRSITDWRLSGTGHPIAIASILPIDLSPHLRPHQHQSTRRT